MFPTHFSLDGMRKSYFFTVAVNKTRENAHECGGIVSHGVWFQESTTEQGAFEYILKVGYPSRLSPIIQQMLHLWRTRVNK